jgi:hypothetical protein
MATSQGRQAAKGSTPARRSETKAERADRNMGELLQELRVALPGVQVLFGFLLTVPFAQGFEKLTVDQRNLYFWILMSTAVATAFLIAPSAMHRVLFQQHDKEHLVKLSNRLAIVGLLVLGISITGAILLIADFIFNGPKVAIFTATIGGLLLALWVALPLYRRLQLPKSQRGS